MKVAKDFLSAMGAKVKDLCSAKPIYNPAIIAQDNLREAIVCMMRAGNYEVKNFGNVILTYSDTPGPDYNVIFYYASENAQVFELEQALQYAQQQRYPFLLVLDQENPSMEVQNVLKQFAYHSVGTATKMCITHNQFKYVEDARVVVKQVVDQNMFEEYCDIIDAAYGRAPQSSWQFMRCMNLLQAASELQLYLAYLVQANELIPVGASMLYLPKNHDMPAGHYAWAVKNSYRRQGIMTALVNKAVLIAGQKNYNRSVAQCFAASVGLAKKIGFQECGALYLYINSKGA